MEKTPIYAESYAYALEHGEEQLWKDSLQTNQIVSVYLDSIFENTPTEEAMKDAIKNALIEYGAERVGWILGNTVQNRYWDRDISCEARTFAAFQRIPFERQECGDWYLLSAPAYKINRAIHQYREQMKEQDLKTAEDVIYASELHSYAGQLVVLRPSALQKDCCESKYQYFIAEGGNGCEPSRYGRKVFGEFLFDGEEDTVLRSQILGIANEKCMDESLRTKWQAYQNVQRENNDLKM